MLHWIPATETNNDFARYEIFSAISKNGPYTKAFSAGPVTTPTALHSATIALAQTVYYYVRTARVDSTISGNSDTLNTIFLNVFVGDPALKLTYNHISLPAPSAASSFTITKEYPLGSVNTLTVTGNVLHNDVISVCKAKINYQVLQQNGGCVSKSNTIFGDYSDTKYPDTTYVDSISVLPDGRTILSWSPGFDMDVDSYYVIKRGSSSNQYIAQLAGRTNTTYVFNDTEANDRAVALFIQAVDSCGKRGPFDERPVTMHLRAEYEYCNYRTRLEWNRYEAMKKGVKHYKIYYSLDGGPFQVAGYSQNGAYVHDSVPPDRQVCYFIRVVNGDESITASSNRTCFYSRQVEVPALNYIMQASVNRGQDVEVEVAVDPTTRFTTLDLQRSESGADFSTVATLPFTAEQYYRFTDDQAETGRTPYYYRVLLRDSCGNARSVSNISRTIHLRVTAESTDAFQRHLSWTLYEGYSEGVAGYNIYRIINDESYPTPIAFVPAHITSYTDDLMDVAAEGSSIDYMVEAVERAGSTGGFLGRSSSNVVPVYLEGRIFVPNAFCPEGINKTWKPVTHFVDRVDYRVWVFNRWGEEVFYANDHESEWDGRHCQAGVYVYLIQYRNARGEYLEHKGTVMLVR